MLECVNSMSLPSPTAGEEISNCLSSHWQHTHKHTHRPLCSSSRQSCWKTASSWLALSQSQALLVFHTQVEKKSYPKPATATVYPRKKTLQDIFLFLLQHSYPSNPHPRAFTCLDLKCSLSEGYLWPPLLLALTCVSYPDSVWICLAGWHLWRDQKWQFYYIIYRLSSLFTKLKYIYWIIQTAFC